MKWQWHHRALAALAIPPLCILFMRLWPDQGRRAFHAFGTEFGFERIKSNDFLVWQGELVGFPDWILMAAIFVSTGVAIAIACHHFWSTRVDG